MFPFIIIGVVGEGRRGSPTKKGTIYFESLKVGDKTEMFSPNTITNEPFIL